MKRVQTRKAAAKWNLTKLEDEAYKFEFQRKCDAVLKETQLRTKDSRETQIREDIESIWVNLKECLTEVAEEVCGKVEFKKKQKWMTDEIMKLMKERQECKCKQTLADGKRFKELKHVIQKMCRVAKEEYYNVKCRELEELDRVHNNLLYDKVKEFQPKAHKMMQQI